MPGKAKNDTAKQNVKFPHIQYIYNLMGVKNRVKNVHLPDEGHGYELPKRKAVYPFLAEHLGLNYECSHFVYIF